MARTLHHKLVCQAGRRREGPCQVGLNLEPGEKVPGPCWARRRSVRSARLESVHPGRWRGGQERAPCAARSQEARQCSPSIPHAPACGGVIQDGARPDGRGGRPRRARGRERRRRPPLRAAQPGVRHRRGRAHHRPQPGQRLGPLAAPRPPLWVSDNGTDVSTIYGAADGARRRSSRWSSRFPAARRRGTSSTGPTSSRCPAATRRGSSSTARAARSRRGTEPVRHRGRPRGAPTRSTRASRWPARACTPPTSTATHIDVLRRALPGRRTASAGRSSTRACPTGYAPFNVRLSAAGSTSPTPSRTATRGRGRRPRPRARRRLPPSGHSGRRVATRRAELPVGHDHRARAGFGTFAGDLLVGNFGDGRIHAFDPAPATPRGTLRDASGAPVAHRRAVGPAVRQRHRPAGTDAVCSPPGPPTRRTACSASCCRRCRDPLTLPRTVKTPGSVLVALDGFDDPRLRLADQGRGIRR